MNNKTVHKNLTQFNVFDLIDEPIAYNKWYAELAGDIVSGLLLSWLIGQEGDKEGWSHKTNDDIYYATGILANTARRCRRVLYRKNLIAIRVIRINGKRNLFYRPCWETLQDLYLMERKALAQIKQNYGQFLA